MRRRSRRRGLATCGSGVGVVVLDMARCDLRKADAGREPRRRAPSAGVNRFRFQGWCLNPARRRRIPLAAGRHLAPDACPAVPREARPASRDLAVPGPVRRRYSQPMLGHPRHRGLLARRSRAVAVRSPYLDAVRQYGPGGARGPDGAAGAPPLHARPGLRRARRRASAQRSARRSATRSGSPPAGSRGRSRPRGGGSTPGRWRSTSRRWRPAIPPRTSRPCGCT